MNCLALFLTIFVVLACDATPGEHHFSFKGFGDRPHASRIRAVNRGGARFMIFPSSAEFTLELRYAVFHIRSYGCPAGVQFVLRKPTRSRASVLHNNPEEMSSLHCVRPMSVISGFLTF